MSIRTESMAKKANVMCTVCAGYVLSRALVMIVLQHLRDNYDTVLSLTCQKQQVQKDRCSFE